jgi:hypothetical protein
MYLYGIEIAPIMIYKEKSISIDLLPIYKPIINLVFIYNNHTIILNIRLET